ncbi:MAG TPA: hypothetical protein VIE16_00195 [Phenylobacterium sp.]|jgi:hypothetical protein
MRTIAIATLAASGALLASAPALAAPAQVNVTVGPELQEKADKSLGQREVRDLARDLQASIEKRLAKSGAFDGQRIDLVLTDARPNRPTFKQMADRPGLSYQSFGTGGASIEGQAIAPNGHVTPLSYAYFESDIRYARFGGTWADAESTFDRFAYRLARGDLVASR